MSQQLETASEADLPFWKRSHYLDRMTLRELWIAYFQHYTIMTYLGLTAICVVVFAFDPATPLQTLAAVAAGLFITGLIRDARSPRCPARRQFCPRAALLLGPHQCMQE